MDWRWREVAEKKKKERGEKKTGSPGGMGAGRGGPSGAREAGGPRREGESGQWPDVRASRAEGRRAGGVVAVGGEDGCVDKRVRGEVVRGGASRGECAEGWVRENGARAEERGTLTR